MRCFVALDLPSPVRNHLANAIAPLRDRHRLRWVPKDQLHLTLLFAGDLDDDTVDGLAEVVRSAPLPALSLELTQFGWFPPRGIPRVVWAGLREHGDGGVLTRLHATLTAGAVDLGVPREKRGFTPHVTIGRLQDEFGALRLLDDLRERSAALNQKPFVPTALVLYRSTLHPSGPRHEPLVHRAVPDSVTPSPD